MCQEVNECVGPGRERGMRLGMADFRRHTVRAFRTVLFAVAFTERTATSSALDLAEQKPLTAITG